MKLTKIAAATGLFVAALGVSASADAQPYHGDDGHHGYHDRGPDRGAGWRGHDGYRHGWHHRCWNEWHHHHRVRVCR